MPKRSGKFNSQQYMNVIVVMVTIWVLPFADNKIGSLLLVFFLFLLVWIIITCFNCKQDYMKEMLNGLKPLFTCWRQETCQRVCEQNIKSNFIHCLHRQCMQASSQFLFTEKICRAYHGLKRYRFNLLNPRFVSFEVFQQ